MKIVRYAYNENDSYGFLIGKNRIVDLPSLSVFKEKKFPRTVDEFIVSYRSLESLLREVDEEIALGTLKNEDVKLKAPIQYPPKIVCLGLNYRDHAEEAGMRVPEEPVIFMKPRTSIVGPCEPIIKPFQVQKMDYEVELAIIIGRQGKNIPVSEARNYIFGYTVLNDISARDIQFKDGQWTRGKSFDTFAPIGPCITIESYIGEPNNLRLRTKVNEEIRQDSSTNQMVFNVYEVVHHISRVMTLEPCDIISTGTPSGVAAFLKDEDKFLKPGDLVEAEIEKIGVLKNWVIEESEG